MKDAAPKHFDMAKKPMRQMNVLRPITWLCSFPNVWRARLRVNKIRMHGIKPPYLLLCTHMAFQDFMVTTAAVFPHRANYVVAIDGFIGREWLLRAVGGICKRKFTNDIKLIKHINHVLNVNKDILALYPEARYSLIGTNAVLPASLGKLAKMMKVPVVVLNIHGNYLNSPVWNLQKRHNRIEADMTCLFTAEEAAESSVDEINRKINEAFSYDEYEWQRKKQIRIKHKDNASGLHKILYKCAHCGAEYEMTSHGTTLECLHCGKTWTLTEYGELRGNDGVTEYERPSLWYEYEREEVRKEIENGTYCFEDEVIVDSLPNARGFIRLGTGRLRHDMNGFVLEGAFGGEEFLLEKDPLTMYSCHIEFEYNKTGDCIDLSTLSDTYYLFPQGKQFSVTKIALATEELYQYHAANHRGSKRADII
jgi:transcription elongation factor Elf1